MGTGIKIKGEEVSLSDVVCPCFDLRIQDFVDIMSDYKNLSYDDFLNITKAASKCTACSLDVEYYFFQLIDSGLIKESDSKKFTKRIATNTSIKQKFYRFVDKFSPMVSMMRTNYIPIIGKNEALESWIWVANNSMMYEGVLFGSKMNVELTVRNHLGHIKHKEKYFLDRENFLHVNVSQFLLIDTNLDNDEILVGSLQIERLPLEIGTRGTTRPQLEILAKNGGGAVHTQGGSPVRNGGFSCLYRPDVDTIFIAITNTEENKKNDFCIEYPINKTLNPDGSVVKDCISILPKATILYEIRLDKEFYNEYVDQLIQIKWKSTGARSTYVFCTSKNLDQISIDHVT
jgi:hypothetical protein